VRSATCIGAVIIRGAPSAASQPRPLQSDDDLASPKKGEKRAIPRFVTKTAANKSISRHTTIALANSPKAIRRSLGAIEAFEKSWGEAEASVPAPNCGRILPEAHVSPGAARAGKNVCEEGENRKRGGYAISIDPAGNQKVGSLSALSGFSIEEGSQKFPKFSWLRPAPNVGAGPEPAHLRRAETLIAATARARGRKGAR